MKLLNIFKGAPPDDGLEAIAREVRGEAPDGSPPDKAQTRMDRFTLKSIDKNGFITSGDPEPVEGPGYMFTAGLWEWADSPELVVTGMHFQIADGLLGDLAERIRNGDLVAVDGGDVPGVFANGVCVLRALHPSQITPDRFDWALIYKRFKTGEHRDLKLLQVVWPDREGKLPWQDGCDPWAINDQLHLYLPSGEERRSDGTPVPPPGG